MIETIYDFVTDIIDGAWFKIRNLFLTPKQKRRRLIQSLEELKPTGVLSSDDLVLIDRVIAELEERERAG